MPFDLHPRLQQDCLEIGRLELCRILLMNDDHFPWFIMVPEVPGIQEIYQLNSEQRNRFMAESCYLTEQLSAMFRADKMNIAALGNQVPQLHIHHIVRYHDDPGWPDPIWGLFDARPYKDRELADILVLLKQHLTRCQFTV